MIRLIDELILFFFVYFESILLFLSYGCGFIMRTWSLFYFFC